MLALAIFMYEPFFLESNLKIFSEKLSCLQAHAKMHSGARSYPKNREAEGKSVIFPGLLSCLLRSRVADVTDDSPAMANSVYLLEISSFCVPEQPEAILLFVENLY